ncbi:MAG: hypothetical protein LBQ20_08250 [Rhodanobacter sp.]|jgi:hypothetical protein|nr:hypothetical protein [Rhodanobacter sp.]
MQLHPAMAEFFQQFAFISSVLAGFSFTFYGTLLTVTREHRAGTWAAFFTLAASVAFLPVTLGMTLYAMTAPAHSGDFSNAFLLEDPQYGWLSMLFICGLIFLLTSFGISGWIRSRGLGVATTCLSLLGLIVTLVVLGPHVGMKTVP